MRSWHQAYQTINASLVFFSLFFSCFCPKGKNWSLYYFWASWRAPTPLSLYKYKYIYIHLLFKTLSQHAQESRLFLHTGRCEHWPTKVMRRRRATIIECLHEVPTFKCLTPVVRRPASTHKSKRVESAKTKLFELVDFKYITVLERAVGRSTTALRMWIRCFRSSFGLYNF